MGAENLIRGASGSQFVFVDETTQSIRSSQVSNIGTRRFCVAGSTDSIDAWSSDR